MNKLFFLSVILVLVISGNTNAQDRIVQGTVRCFDSIPLIGAEIKVKSTKQVVLSDTLGNFSVACNSKDKLKISANGFNNQNVKLKEDTKLVLVNLNLKPGEKNKEYAIGYASVMDKDKLNAVASMSKNDVDFSMYSDMYELIRGRFAGVQVYTNGDIIIRGVNSINSGSSALIVIDGVPANSGVLSSLSPVQVKNISVLKDGGAAIYGTRGANGVILIETKKGGD